MEMIIGLSLVNLSCWELAAILEMWATITKIGNLIAILRIYSVPLYFPIVRLLNSEVLDFSPTFI